MLRVVIAFEVNSNPCVLGEIIIIFFYQVKFHYMILFEVLFGRQQIIGGAYLPRADYKWPDPISQTTEE